MRSNQEHRRVANAGFRRSSECDAMIKNRCECWRGRIFLGMLAVLLAVVLGRCWMLQYGEVRQCRARVDRQQMKIIPQSGRRGTIVDRRGRVLATSTKVHSVGMDPKLLQDLPETARQLAAVLGLEEKALREKLQARRDTRFMWVKRFVSEAEVKQIQALKIQGVVLETEYQRCYPLGQLAAHVIGFTDIDGRGLAGLELGYEQYLAGKNGKWRLCSDALRRPIGAQGNCQASQDGQIVVLSLDAVIQTYVEEQLEAVVEKFNAAGAVGIVMDPVTGEILALANWPSFDPAKARQTDPDLCRNRALTDPVEPGSIFKPFTVAAAVEGGFVGLEQKIFCHNGYYSGKGIGVIREYDGHGYGDLTVAEIIVRSSNIGAAKVAQKMGKRYFFGMIEKFGFGRKSGIDLPGEDKGILMPLEQWKWGQYALTRAAYGQGSVVATPLQLIRGFCCLANGGRLVRPKVVRGIMSPTGEVVKDLAAPPLSPEQTASATNAGKNEQVISREVAGQMVDKVLVEVVARPEGTANKAAIEGYRVFGKTGTAQVPKKDGRGYEEGKYISSFMAGAPAEDPRVCVLIMVREPDKSLGLGYTGGRVAAPTVREILRQTLAYLGVPKRLEGQEVEEGWAKR